MAIAEKKHFIKGDEALLRLFLQHQKPYNASLLGKTWVVLPNVFSPAYSPDVAHFVPHFPSLKGKSFLEIGCGSGIASIEAALRGASSVVAVDLNPAAVKNTRLNALLHKVQKIVHARKSNLFSSIKKSEKFDIIFFNAPFGYRNKPIHALLEKSVWDYHYETQKRFLKNARKYLSSNGAVLVGFSTIGHIGEFKKNAHAYNYRVKQLYNKKVRDLEGIHSFKLYVLTPT